MRKKHLGTTIPPGDSPGDGEGESTWLKEVKICSCCEVNETGFLLRGQQMMV